ncbi:protein of unknown function DUF1501 [Pirellula staleyi DSM 6068]|uniref:DUF1501 domain-containing protein n=1 Tax=Pirellula staleyi (strain ATCC 27377 / DSM 6068 / ICPB 4128) TaxID=530564 RepID=D2R6U7_PIRSD|nr:DUF1501 domain-containing protein [Pirellula staleyi]ADB17397.1 protein of unknown function DUF1501 [Pirellula staleyi DSM 6068]
MQNDSRNHARNSHWLSRREMLTQAGAGFGGLALSSLLEGTLRADSSLSAAGKPAPHYEPRAKSVIFLFMEGGPSHIDLFDPKPELEKLAGQPLPASFKPVILAMGESNPPIMPSPRKWKQHGEGGLWVSDWLPHTATMADDLCVVRSLYSDGINHSGGVCQMNTGSTIAGRPSLGSWVTYGLGSENKNLPSFVVLEDNANQVINGPRNWGAGFMPAVHQGTPLRSGDEPIRYLKTPSTVSSSLQKEKLELLEKNNRLHARERASQSELEARIASYELAFRMQAEAPEAVDLNAETAETKALYGIDEKETESFGRMCLLARRMVERGVRFIQLYSGAGSKWDAHANIEKNHSGLCKATDKPIAGLLADLKRRGLLDDTLVVWGGEFGRTPMSEKGNGRDHNPTGFTMWMAGAKLKGGRTVGSTDEIGLHAAEDRLHVHDFHATILRLLGIDNMELVYMHKNRPERPTLNEGAPCEKIING